MNNILKLWTSVLKNIAQDWVETLGCLNDMQDGFRPFRDIYDGQSAHISALENAKLQKQNIFAAYVDFRSAFNGMDHRWLFRILNDFGFPDQFIKICQGLYRASTTSYVTPYGCTPPIAVLRGTLQGDTLSPFLFSIFLEPLLKWLTQGNRGYTYSGVGRDTPTYPGHGYVDDVSIVTHTLQNLKIQLYKLESFCNRLHLPLEIIKCLATGALWSYGNPMAARPLSILKDAIHSLHLTDETGQPQKLTFLPPNASAKLLGLDIAATLDTRPHKFRLLSELRTLTKALSHFSLSADRKLRILKTLIIPKIFTLPLGVFDVPSLKTFQALLNAATRNILSLVKNFPNEALTRPATQAGLSTPSIFVISTTRLIEHLTTTLNSTGHKGDQKRAHVALLCKKYQHHPFESLDSARTELPTLRALAHAKKIGGVDFRGFPSLHLDNDISRTLREAVKSYVATADLLSHKAQSTTLTDSE